MHVRTKEKDQSYDTAIDKRLLLGLSRIETKYHKEKKTKTSILHLLFVWITAKMVQKYKVLEIGRTKSTKGNTKDGKGRDLPNNKNANRKMIVPVIWRNWMWKRHAMLVRGSILFLPSSD